MTRDRVSGTAGLRPRDSLSANDRSEMFSLLSRHFEGVAREQFERDLAEKNWVVEVRNAGRLLGFSTLLAQEAESAGRVLTVICSGDTIVAPEAWGTPALARNWIAAVNWLRLASPSRPCYWLLLTSGFRTYRFLPVFWKSFYPRYDAPTPACQQRILDDLASSRYGGCYNPTTGIVRFPRPQRLRGPLAALPPGRERKPEVAFFLARNPGHAHGDELACLTEIDATNLTPAGQRMIALPPG